MNTTLKLIENRRSIRKYSNESITPEEKDLILSATLRAPTAGNMMLYSIIEVNDQEIKNKLAESCDHQPFIAKAPWVLLFLADYQRWWDYYQHSQVNEFCKEKNLLYREPGEGDVLLACCDALIAAQTAVIAAESLGIGSCYIGDILENYEFHRELFALPQYVLPITVLCLGKPDIQTVQQHKSPRFEREYIVFKNTYKELDGFALEQMFQPTQERYFNEGGSMGGAQNFSQFNYQRKFSADFSIEMARSVKEMLKNWTGVSHT